MTVHLREPTVSGEVILADPTSPDEEDGPTEPIDANIILSQPFSGGILIVRDPTQETDEDPVVPEISSVNNGSSIRLDDTDIPVTGVSMPTTGDVLLVSGAHSSVLPVSSRSETGFTIDSIVLGSCFYSSSGHSVDIQVGDLTQRITLDPPSGFVAYGVNSSSINQVEGESVLSTVGSISGDCQLVVPNRLNSEPISWETEDNRATGRIIQLEDVLLASVSLDGVEFHDTTGWDSIPTVLTIGSGESYRVGIVTEVNTVYSVEQIILSGWSDLDIGDDEGWEDW